jgi:Fur family ferric uptake transcriptional regulator
MNSIDAPKAERSTRQRAAIRDAIEQAGRPLLAQEVLELAGLHVPRLGIATVYRNIKAMVEEGAIKQVLLPGENPRFELAGHAHHHHFQCYTCQKVFDIHSCPSDLLNLAPKGFKVESHDLTLYGRCKDC